MITNIDDNFKRIEDKLEELDISDNTVLIFTTDNGTAGGVRVFDAGMKEAKEVCTKGDIVCRCL